MERKKILSILKGNESALRNRGVLRAAVFGSRARGDHGADSDTDIMVEIDPNASITVYDYVALKEYISALFEGPVDIVSAEGLKRHVRPAALDDAIYAF